MSRQLINEYRAELDRLRAISGKKRESILREAFKDLLKRWGRAHDLQFVAEHDIVTRQMNRIYVDGALLHGLRVPFGYWEAKDEDDDLQAEIEDKFRKGYPKDNIIFTDDQTAVLWQDGAEVIRADMQAEDGSLLSLLTCFFNHERQEIVDFNKSVKQFAIDLPAILTALRDRVDAKYAIAGGFAEAMNDFLNHARSTINPSLNEDDVREMLIQHILTEDIFAKVFNDPEFHRKNNVASELYKLEDKLFARGEKSALLRALNPYYAGIASAAALIQGHSEKQGFLKALYEDFYKAYNRKAADRLGVVYTPGEIVRFMIRSSDWLCEKYFQKSLIDRGVEILDPATGTGTFIAELLEYFRGNRARLTQKYKNELHANEVAILPYYVANLNIEATFQAITGQFEEFNNLCLVDTLDNIDALGIHSGHQFDLLGSLTEENVERIKRQNHKKISIIIGNPPYNANQHNENDNNKNRIYDHIDDRIRKTYIRESTAQKTKLYDMYARFFRWAADRIGDDGIVAFITNRSFIDAKTFDGFRSVASKEFSDVYVVDLGGDYRRGEEAGGGGNVFGIGTGVAISFWIKSPLAKKHQQLHYCAAYAGRAEDKLSWLSNVEFSSIKFTTEPIGAEPWVGRPENRFADDTLLLADRQKKTSQARSGDRSIFRLFSLGVVSARDEWVWDRDRHLLESKVRAHLTVYDKWLDKLKSGHDINLEKEIYDLGEIKWSRLQRAALERHEELYFKESSIRQGMYRPFNKEWFYYDNRLNEVIYQTERMFKPYESNPAITIMGDSTGKPYFALAIDTVPDYNFVSSGSGGTQTFSRFRYTKNGERVDNVTDWAVNKFTSRYGKRAGVSKSTIFYYVYAVLHDPAYRKKYAQNLKREFPRIPFFGDFKKWAEWGELLCTMHIGFEDVEPWPIERVERPKRRAEGTRPKSLLQALSDKNLIRVDEDTQIVGIPSMAWKYQLGNRSAIEWVLDQYKEKTPRDQVIREKFSEYRFADYKESMIPLLAKVVRISVDTMMITEAMVKGSELA